MKKLVIFVHGLGGSKATWGNFKNFIEADPDLNVDSIFWDYPTPFAGIKLFQFLQKKFQSIDGLAKSLKTHIDLSCSEYSDIILVGHSMGGLVIRKYLLNERQALLPLKVSRVLLYAVPNLGAGYAYFINEICSNQNPHVFQLTRKSEFLTMLNDGWRDLRLERDVDLTNVVAGNDRIVDERSAIGNFISATPHTISNVGHIDVVKPKSKDDLSYVLFKSVVLKKKYLPERLLDGGRNFLNWQKYPKKFEFVCDEKRRIILHSIVAELQKRKGAVRVLGLSGLGKTRLIYEAVKIIDRELQEQVLYVDVATENLNLKSWLKNSIEAGYEGILIVDNCKPDLHEALCSEVERSDCQISLISIDHTHESLSSSRTKQFKIEQMETLQIKELLEQEYGGRIADLDRVASFAQGFPRMAVLIAEARLANDPEVGKLSDSQLSNRLLGSCSDEELEILKACSLFDRFGLEEDLISQYHYLAIHVVNTTAKKFYACITKFHRQGLIDISGRYAQLVPKPLAIFLASEWWRATSRQDQLAFLETIPEELLLSFCRQVTMLGFVSEVQKITTDLCGQQSPFGQAEVILSDRGSLLLRSFSEVNPIATVSAIHGALHALDRQKLLKISGEVRRNLVWTLEKLAFHSDAFERAAWSQMMLASAENEEWGNNATGMFVQLFRVFLSGTAANFTVRIDMLKEAYALQKKEIDLVLIKAANAAVESRVTRTIGAENQGAGTPLKEWRPQVWQEIFDYWDSIFDLLLDYAVRPDDVGHEARKVIGNSIRELMNSGRIATLDKAIRRIVLTHGKYWPEALGSIQLTLEYDTKGMNDAGVNALNEWIVLLTPDQSNLHELLLVTVVNPPWQHKETLSKSCFIDVAASRAMEVANEFIERFSELKEFVPVLVTGDQKQTFVFGQVLAAKSTSDLDSFIQHVVAEILKIDRPNLDLLKGVLNGLFQRSKTDWNEWVDRFFNEDAWLKFLPAVLITGEFTEVHLLRVLEKVNLKLLDPTSLSGLSIGRSTNHLSIRVVSEFCLNLSEVNPDSAWVAMDILFMHCYGDEAKFQSAKFAFKKLVTRVSLAKGQSIHLTLHHWMEVTKKLIVTEDAAFCVEVCQSLICAAEIGFKYGDIWHALRPVVSEMFVHYPNEVWGVFSEEIIAADGPKLYWLRSLFDRSVGVAVKYASLFSILPIELVVAWCESHPEKATSFVAQSINIFEVSESGDKQITPIFLELLIRFSDTSNVGKLLSLNLGLKSWSGSLVPHLRSDRAALAPLLTHSSMNVRVWVQQFINSIDREIAREIVRDAENFDGYY